MEWSRDYQNELKNFEINLWKNEFAHKKRPPNQSGDTIFDMLQNYSVLNMVWDYIPNYN